MQQSRPARRACLSWARRPIPIPVKDKTPAKVRAVAKPAITAAKARTRAKARAVARQTAANRKSKTAAKGI